MSRGFHAFFRQYYNLRALLRRADPDLRHLRPIADYPLVLAGGHRDSFTGIPSTPPWNMLAFVARSPSFTLGDLREVDLPSALGLLDVAFPRTFLDYEGVSAAEVLDRLRFPAKARHLALEVFARSFFADPAQFSGGELVAMFHTYFLGSAEGLLFDVPDDDYDTALWAPLGRHLARLGVRVETGVRAESVDESGDGRLAVRLADGRVPVVDAVVLATDPAPLRSLVERSPALGDADWRARVTALRTAPAFAVWRLWLDRRAADGSPPFLGTSGYGPLDNVSLLELFEEGAARWSREHGGSVVEMHAYALPEGTDEAVVRAELLAHLHTLHPELAQARILGEQWLVERDCPLIDTGPWSRRPGVTTPDPRVVLAGDGIRCEYPVALMERAATTGFMAANALLQRWGRRGHDLWTVPMSGRHPVVPSLRRMVAGGAAPAHR